MNPKPIFQAGLLACMVTAMVACHSSQSATCTKPEKTAMTASSPTIQLPKVSQEMQVEVVTTDRADKDKKKTNR